MAMDCSSLTKLVECVNNNISILYRRPACLRDRKYMVYMIVFGDGSYYIGKSEVAYQRLHHHCLTKMGKVKNNYIPKLAHAFTENDDFSIYCLSEIKAKEEPNENDFLSAFQPPLNTVLCQKCKRYGTGYIKANEMYKQIIK